MDTAIMDSCMNGEILPDSGTVADGYSKLTVEATNTDSTDESNPVTNTDNNHDKINKSDNEKKTLPNSTPGDSLNSCISRGNDSRSSVGETSVNTVVNHLSDSCSQSVKSSNYSLDVKNGDVSMVNGDHTFSEDTGVRKEENEIVKAVSEGRTSSADNDSSRLQDKDLNSEEQTGDVEPECFVEDSVSLCSKTILKTIEETKKKLAQSVSEKMSSSANPESEKTSAHCVENTNEQDNDSEQLVVDKSEHKEKDDLEDSNSSDPEISFKENTVQQEDMECFDTESESVPPCSSDKTKNPTLKRDIDVHNDDKSDNHIDKNDNTCTGNINSTPNKPLPRLANTSVSKDSKQVTPSAKTIASSPMIKPMESLRREPRAKMSMSPCGKVTMGSFTAAVTRRGSGHSSSSSAGSGKVHSARKSLTDFSDKNQASVREAPKASKYTSNTAECEKMNDLEGDTYKENVRNQLPAVVEEGQAVETAGSVEGNSKALDTTSMFNKPQSKASDEVLPGKCETKAETPLNKPKPHTARKSIPKARKSAASNNNKISVSETVACLEQDITQVNLFPIANVTLKLPEIEKVLGIKAKSLEKCLSPAKKLEQETGSVAVSENVVMNEEERVKTEPEDDDHTFICDEHDESDSVMEDMSSHDNTPLSEYGVSNTEHTAGASAGAAGLGKGGRRRKRRRLGTYDLPRVHKVNKEKSRKLHNRKGQRLSLPANLERTDEKSLLSDSVCVNPSTSFEDDTVMLLDEDEWNDNQPKTEPDLPPDLADVVKSQDSDADSGSNANCSSSGHSQPSKSGGRIVSMVSLLTGKTTLTVASPNGSTSQGSATVTVCDSSPLTSPESKSVDTVVAPRTFSKSPTENSSKQAAGKKHFKVDYTKQKTISEMFTGSQKKTDVPKCEGEEERANTPVQQSSSCTDSATVKEDDGPVCDVLDSLQSGDIETPPDSLNDLETNSQSSLGSRRSLRKRKTPISDDDNASIVSTAPSLADSDTSSVHSVKGKRLRTSESGDDYCVGQAGQLETDPIAPVLTPQKVSTPVPSPHKIMPPLIPAPELVKHLTSPSVINKRKDKTSSSYNKHGKLDDMIYTHPLHFEMMNKVVQGSQVLDDAASVPHPLQGSPALPLAAKNGQRQPMRYMNTPNGISYPVTPPKTPETSNNGASPLDKLSQPFSSSGERDFIPLCCCKINGTSFASLAQPVYCQALDSVDGKVIGCCNKVTNGLLVRPAVKVPFMAVCELHRKRLKLHQCCPGCGHFCTQGKFYQCKQEDGTATHNFHRMCQVFKDDKYFCPHCGEESSQYEVILHMSETRVRNFFHKEEPKRSIPKARISFGSRTREKSEESEVDTSATATSIQIADTDRQVTSEGLPFGPTRTDLEKIMAAIILENSSASGSEDGSVATEKDAATTAAAPSVVSKKPKKLRYPNRNLFGAAKGKELDKILWMLSEGYDPNFKFEDNSNQTALHAACTGGSLAIVHCLVQAGASPHPLSTDLWTPFMCAAENNHVDIMRYLYKCGAVVDCKSEDGMTAIHLAAKAGCMEAVRFLVQECKQDVNTKDDGGWTPIIWASEYQHERLIRYLLSQGADPSIKDNEENTALHWAAFSGSVAIAEIFLNAGCSLENANEHGDRPLHIAARQDHYQCVVLFLARGADSEARNNENEAPISCCIDQSSPAWMALRVNRQLKGFAAKRLQQTQQLLHRDVSFGKEPHNPIPCVNAVDADSFPTDYLYVIENVETTPMNINRVITSLQACKCNDDCSSVYCECSRNSVRCWYDKEGKLVRDFNLMEPPLLFECNKACQCWTNCNNRVVQNGITCRLQLFKTVGRGWGVRSLLDIPTGTFICEYIGELISDAEADRREDDSYLFDLDNKDGETYCIDARKYGNISRFINHLCEPNLIPVRVFVEHQDLRFPRICFFSSRDIKAGEELGFDYGEKFWIIKWKQFTCACGSFKCKYSKETIQRTIQEYNKRQAEEAEEEEEK